MNEKVVMIFHIGEKSVDIEAPLDITANEFVLGINTGFNLGLDLNNPDENFLRAENPVALVKGEKTLAELGLRNGTSIFAPQR
ncbi:EsaB/YukD family protein [Pseudobutyrivibrio ruminis]|jgi:hypothetical protein|uniref:WXG100 protein secretion system (Wss), protein YukD n=1 Tax=Pseudobutyrivibrio ruminis TaxID=46206 RepID=A0A2G3DXE6_9FIRM|nr:EsaB/YukD family protein [Pseudobutyrivibrio ruminis]PHU35696.1 hypothetical protein CSX01_03590 [Pseudobutyrivibrio ruminis]